MEIERQKAELVAAIRFLHSKGWAPATTSNYSVRVSATINPFAQPVYLISQTGRDKGEFTAADLMFVNAEGQTVYPPSARPSAETLLHTLLYEDPAVGCVLHTHSVANTVLSFPFNQMGEITFRGYEIVKALAGNTTHEDTAVLPVFPNSQDMRQLADDIRPYLKKNPQAKGFVLAGHGLYAWGANVAEAKRHVEVWEFLLACRLAELSING